MIKLEKSLWSWRKKLIKKTTTRKFLRDSLANKIATRRYFGANGSSQLAGKLLKFSVKDIYMIMRKACDLDSEIATKNLINFGNFPTKESNNLYSKLMSVLPEKRRIQVEKFVEKIKRKKS